MFSLTTFLVDIAALIVLILVTAFDGDDSGSKTISILNIVMISSLGIELFCLLMTILISSQAFCCGKDVTGKLYNDNKSGVISDAFDQPHRPTNSKLSFKDHLFS